MYPVSNSVAALFDANQKQVLRITGTDRNSNAISITDDDVMEGSFSIDRYSCNGNRLELGTAIAAELSMQLDNSTGKFDSIIFEGTELFVEIGIADWTQASPTVTWIPCGYFTPDEQPRRRTIITVSALDRMTKLDVEVTPTYITLPATMANLVAQVCTICNLTLAESIASKPNASYVVNELPELQQVITYRNIIQWCASLMGTCAFFDWAGNLCFKWYTNTGYTSTMDRRYSSDMQEGDITITGITYSPDNETIYLAGSKGYTLDVSDNYLIDGTDVTAVTTVISTIYTAISPYAYRPFQATVKPAPWLFPMDRIAFTDNNGVSHASLLTNVNLCVNGNTVLEAKGETPQTNSYAAPRAMTAQQEKQLQVIQKVTSDALDTAIDNATAQITGANGGYVRFMYSASGVMQEIIITDTPDLTDPTAHVWRWNKNGFGFSSTGYSGTYGTAITQDGQIVADYITTGTLNANIIKAGIISDAANKNSWNMTTGELTMASGSINIGNGKFTVNSSGVMSATGATINGVFSSQTAIDNHQYNLIRTENGEMNFYHGNTQSTPELVRQASIYAVDNSEDGRLTYFAGKNGSNIQIEPGGGANYGRIFIGGWSDGTNQGKVEIDARNSIWFNCTYGGFEVHVESDIVLDSNALVLSVDAINVMDSNYNWLPTVTDTISIRNISRLIFEKGLLVDYS